VDKDRVTLCRTVPDAVSVSTWAPAVAAAITGALTGGFLILQSTLADRRARRQKEDEDRRLKERREDGLLEARVNWI
jgi:hypothetical protein